MSKHRSLVYGAPLPQDFLDAIQEYISTLAVNLRITASGTTAVQVVAGAGNDQVSIGIQGLWRYNSATVNASAPGGAAGQYDIFVVGSANSFAPGVGNETDNTDYTFGLRVVAHNTTPTGSHNGHAITVTRKIGEVTWDGSAITSIQNLLVQAVPALSVTSAQIVDGTIVDADVAADTLTARVIAPGAVGASEIADGTITDTEIAAANKDGVAGTASMRTLGTGATQAAAGNDGRLSDQRVPTANSVDSGKIVDGSVTPADLSFIPMRAKDATHPWTVYFGQTSHFNPGGGNATITSHATLPVTLSAVPLVTTGGTNTSAAVINKTTSGFDITVFVAPGDTEVIDWIAIGYP